MICCVSHILGRRKPTNKCRSNNEDQNLFICQDPLWHHEGLESRILFQNTLTNRCQMENICSKWDLKKPKRPKITSWWLGGTFPRLVYFFCDSCKGFWQAGSQENHVQSEKKKKGFSQRRFYRVRLCQIHSVISPTALIIHHLPQEATRARWKNGLPMKSRLFLFLARYCFLLLANELFAISCFDGQWEF